NTEYQTTYCIVKSLYDAIIHSSLSILLLVYKLKINRKFCNKKPLNRGALKSIQSLKLKIFNLYNFVFHFALRRYDFHFVAFAFAQKTTSDRRVHRDLVDLKVCFIIAYNLIGLLFFGV